MLVGHCAVYGGLNAVKSLDACCGPEHWPGTLAYRGHSKYKTYVQQTPWIREKQLVEEVRWHARQEHLLWQLKE